MQTVTTVGLLMVVAGSAFAQAGDGLEYQSQNSAVTNLHSSIVTEGNGMYRDTRFAREFDNNVLCRQAIFLFGQCYGGGMLDEINTRAANWAIPVAGISAARHDQLSWARSEDTTSGFDPFLNNANTPAPLRARRTESTYALRWFPPATNAPKTTVRVASVIARNNDVRGPVAPAAEFRLTNPQYSSTGNAADGMRLHEGSTRYRAVLWGGSTRVDRGSVLQANGLYTPTVDIAANWNSLERAHDSLVAAGYQENEILVMYPGARRNNAGQLTGTKYPGGANLPAWVDRGTRTEDMTYALTNWLANESDANTQVFFWSSFGHGARHERLDTGGWQPRVAVNQVIDGGLAQQMLDIHQYYSNPDNAPPEGEYALPTFVAFTTVAVPNFSVMVNGAPLSLIATQSTMDPTNPLGMQYSFAIPEPTLIAMASGSVDVTIDYNFQGTDGGQYDLEASFLEDFGPSTGGLSNGLSIPAPGAVALLGIGMIGAGRRKRQG
jgi:hypothetical protein